MSRSILFFILTISLMLSSCGGMLKIRDGNTAFELKKYALAIELLLEEYESTRFRDVKAEKAFLLGESYARTGNYKSASGWYLEAANLGFGSRAIEGYAATLMNLEEYDRAANVYGDLIQNYGSLDIWESSLRIAKSASQWMEKVEDLPYRISEASFNSPASDYAPVFFDSTTVVFSSDRFHNNASGNTYAWTGRGFFNYFTYDLAEEKFTDQFDFLNSNFNEGTLAFTNDREQVFFTRCKSVLDGDDGFCRIWFAEKKEGFWMEPQMLPFQEADGNYAHPAVDDEGEMLIFSFKAKGDPEGYDLYVSYRRGPEWLDPIRLQGGVNTSGNELFPFLHNDTLYFSSDGHPGLGGLDIFQSVRNRDGSWGEVFNLMPPFNSGADDFGYVVNTFHPPSAEILKKGYFSSNRDGSADRIFYFEQFDVIEPPAKEEEITFSLRVQGIIYEHLYEDPNDPNSKRLGRRNLPNAMVEVIGPETTDSIRTSRDAVYTSEIEYTGEFIVAASAPGFLRKSVKIDQSGITKDPNNPHKIIPLDIILDRMFVDREVIMQDIYYDFDEWFIREDANPTLDALAFLMEDNPGIVIELASHTDCRGGDDYNERLSQNRAQAAVDYLVAQGIDQNRLRAKGYGKSRLRVDCICEECTEEEHQANRRTTFRILGTDSQ